MTHTDENHWDLIVIGGGAAGYFSAISAAEAGCQRVLILEKSPQVLGKVKVSGGGRCNVTHDCLDPKALVKFYPRGEKSLIGPLHRWGAADTIEWFESRGVELKTEADGRIFPVTDSSQTIIDCLQTAARDAGVMLRTRCGVESIKKIPAGEESEIFQLAVADGERLTATNILLATGGTRLAAGAKLAAEFGHKLEPPVPSLFTFNIKSPLLAELPGLSVPKAIISSPKVKGLKTEGPLLITHWGLSGPAALKFSAWGARVLHDCGYQFKLEVNWLAGIDTLARFSELRNEWGKRTICKRSPFSEIPKRLWERMVEVSGISGEMIWSQLPKQQAQALAQTINHSQFQAQGKSINKDEFVTCGGVKLPEVNLKTMQSKLCPGLYFAGEILNIDGLTGGFNFQNAWTTGYLAGIAIADAS